MESRVSQTYNHSNALYRPITESLIKTIIEKGNTSQLYGNIIST